MGSADATETSSDSCIACHSGGEPSASDVVSGTADSFSLPSGHTLTPGATENSPSARIGGCNTCHDPHGASDAKRGIPARRVNGVAVSSAGKGLCLACHDDADSWFGSGYPSTSKPTRDATGYPVSGTWPGPTTYDGPTNAHRLIPEATRTVGFSEPVRRERGDCLYCHAAHGGSNAYDGLVDTFTVPVQSTLASDRAEGSYAALCFTCHGGDTPSGFASAPTDIRRYATDTGGSGGHSIVTSGGILPVGAPLPCFECHNPHGSKRGNASMISDERGASLSTTSAAGVRAFCFTCHTTSDTADGWDSTAETYTPVASNEKIVGLRRDGAKLHLSAADGHAEHDSTSCYDCHGDSYAAGGHNVHDPSSGPSLEGTQTLLVLLEPSLIPSGAVIASASAEPSATLEATASVEPTASLEPTPAVAPTDTPLPVAVQPVFAARRGSWIGAVGT